MGVNVHAEEQIYSELMEARRIPSDLFVGSAETVAKLHNAIENAEFGSDVSLPGQQ